MANDITHFAIHADDCERAMKFYQQVFGWRFDPWGPPGFWMIYTSPDGIHGALHGRENPVAVGGGMNAYQCTIGVEDIQAAVVNIEAAGGKIVSPPFTIETVGIVAQFEDTEGNQVSVMQYSERRG